MIHGPSNVKWHSNLRGEILPCPLRNVLSFILGDKDKSWAPHICCAKCVRLLTGWVNGSRRMPFAIPLVQREPNDHSFDRYFCLTNITRINSKSIHTVKYLDFQSAMKPVQHNKDFPVPKPRKLDFYRWQLWFWQRTRTERSGKCWSLSDISSKLFLIWTPFINTRRSKRPCPWFEFV